MKTLLWLWAYTTSYRRDGDATYASANASAAAKAWQKRKEAWSVTTAPSKAAGPVSLLDLAAQIREGSGNAANVVSVTK